MASSSSSEANALDNHRFRILFNQKLYEETVCDKEIIAEVGFNLKDNEYPEMRQQIALRGWRRLASPREAAKTMIREFFANASRSEDEMDGQELHPYTSHVRGFEIDFSPTTIRRVMRFKEDTPGAENNYDYRQKYDQQLDTVIRELCIEGATWKMSKGRNPRPIQLRRPDLFPVARGWQEFIINNIIPTSNKSEITVARAVLIHCIMKGENVRAEELIADNIAIIAQGLGGNCQLGFPSTIYKLCKEAGVRMREFKNMEEVDVGRYITKEVMEKVRIPRIFLPIIDHNEGDDIPMPQYIPGNEAENADVGNQDQDQEQHQHFEHHFEPPPHFEQQPQHFQQKQPQYVTYADFQQF
ncbi:hypothetical protein PIB30_056754 [Stylosanthes scabra]|uniref:Putative plant transposon protein domain-containing protein n=1 Tax=Stylosanthes scabra TaxID=79078 RepID=A0ABU6RJD7_9FABA|nr:hypothetical protein [Stylosanthes scabra]